MTIPKPLMVRGPLTRLFAGAVLGLFVAGCNRDQIKVYRLEKEPAAPPPMSGQDTMPSGHPDVGAPAPPRLTWKLPGGWNEVTPGQMRVASFSIKGADGKQADVSVIPLPGAAGGDFANVNRWRGQVGLEPLPEDAVKSLAEEVEIAGQPAELYDIAGKNPGDGAPTRILAAIQHRDDIAWFFKMTGDDQVVAGQKSAFVAFLSSLRFEAAVTSALPPSHPPVEGMGLSGQMAPAEAAGGAKPDWQVPTGWQEAPAGQFLVAKFVVTGEDGAEAAVNVSSSAGDGGGLVANVNRWRRQLGLSALSEADMGQLVSSVAVPGGKAEFVDLSGTDARSGQPARLVAAVVPEGGQTWFYKLMGDSKLVERERAAFDRFVQSAKY